MQTKPTQLFVRCLHEHGTSYNGVDQLHLCISLVCSSRKDPLFYFLPSSHYTCASVRPSYSWGLHLVWSFRSYGLAACAIESLQWRSCGLICAPSKTLTGRSSCLPSSRHMIVPWTSIFDLREDSSCLLAPSPKLLGDLQQLPPVKHPYPSLSRRPMDTKLHVLHKRALLRCLHDRWL